MKTEIHLQGMEFHAFHGVYPEEKKLGNRFRVDVLMKLDVALQPENEDLSRRSSQGSSGAQLIRCDCGHSCRCVQNHYENGRINNEKYL